jgi:predicted nuclease of predicted toxin-antitoxin system
MGIARSTGQFLRTLGHDVVHLVDQGLERLPDDQIVEKALEENRVIVTHDLDFGRIVALSRGTVPSVVTLRLSDMTPRHVNEVLETALHEADALLENGVLVTVTNSGIRMRELPVDLS